ncbi:hypothetical protein JQX13_50310 [Archangium violaceum]|uniref:hypothetical protein n=1 Tax=Archangium violaceum TaxID=83451 RepID=UPI00193C01A0|nr:hypothetical protein [Archangium violaceum]QRK08063.1 hypothetical protein JQX13_50310 [Archangium violaceum]
MLSFKTLFSAVAVAALVVGTAALAEPPASYTSSTKLGLKSSDIQRDLYQAAKRLVEEAKRVTNFTPAEEECGKITAAERFLEETKKALEGNIFGPDTTLAGHEEASKILKSMNDEWCKGKGGGAGATKIAKSLGRVRSIVRPFIQERFDELKEIGKGRAPTPAEAAAIAAAAIGLLVTSPAWAF